MFVVKEFQGKDVSIFVHNYIGMNTTKKGYVMAYGTSLALKTKRVFGCTWRKRRVVLQPSFL